MWLLHAFVITGAFLMFVLQPLTGRVLLPAYGGGFQVWSTCMMFFQGVLLLGYLYAHFVLPRLGRGHAFVVLLSLVALPLSVRAPTDPSGSVIELAFTLLLQVGAPFAVLSTTGVAGQLHVAQLAEPSRDPYRLYAASNLGSLVGLLGYPFLIEPFVGLRLQSTLWSCGYVAYVLLALVVALRWRAAPPVRSERPTARRLVYWAGLSATAVMLMLGATNLVSLGAGSVPLVWVLTFAIYLTSFIVAFGRHAERAVRVRRYALEAALLGALCMVDPLSMPDLVELALVLVCVFLLCVAAHAELHATRPPAAQLTGFYLSIATGGFLGGCFVTLAVPALFSGLHEFALAMVLLLVVLALGNLRALREWLRARVSWAAAQRFEYGRWVRSLVLAGASVWLVRAYLAPTQEHTLRSPYGIFSVWDSEKGAGKERYTIRTLDHNNTTHGFQSMRAGQRRVPAGYYHRDSPLGEVLQRLPRPARMGVIGLGTGTVAAHFGSGDEVVFYEIDPLSERIARTWFSYLADTQARVGVVIGDARLSLQRESERSRHTALLVDAFSGDAIPFHLLTREALALYLSRVEPGAPVIFHISNRYYNLAPSLAATARSLGASAAHKQRSRQTGQRLDRLEWATQYLVVSTDPMRIDALGREGWMILDRPRAAPWTDDRVNLVSALWQELTRD